LTDEVTKYGSLRIVPGATEIHIMREYGYGADALWQALTESDRLVHWLAPGSIEPREGGSVRFDFPDSGIVIDSRVTEFDPPRAISWSWSAPGEPPRPIRFEVADTGQTSRLLVTIRVPAGEDAARMAAGFDAHLEMLAAALAGTPIAFPFATFKALRAAYQTA